MTGGLLDPAHAGRPLPTRLATVLDSRGLRVTLRVLGVVGTGYVVMAAVFGRDDALNPTAGVVYVLLWTGVPLLSILLGPVWKLVNPMRSLHWALSRMLRTDPAEGLAPLPPSLGYWPAAASLLAFVWLELIAPENTSLPVLRTFFAAYLAVHLLAATYWGSAWFDRGDGFEVFSSLAGRLSVLGRRADGWLIVRNPLAGVAGTPVAPGLFAVVGVLLGSTAYDSFSNSPTCVTRLQDGPFSAEVTGTLGLLGAVVLVTLAFSGAAALSGRRSGLRPLDVAGEYAHSLVPIVIGVRRRALLVLVRADRPADGDPAVGPARHRRGLAGHRRPRHRPDAGRGDVHRVCCRWSPVTCGLLPRGRALVGQVPLLVLMVCYTVGGLSLLFAA